MTAPRKKTHKGRKRLGKEPFETLSFAISPSMMDAILLHGENGFGKKSTVARGLVEAGIAAGVLDELTGRGDGGEGDCGDDGVAAGDDAGESAASDADEGDGVPKARKPGPGPKRIGRERMVSVTTMLEPATVRRIEAAAEAAGLPRGDVLRRCAQAGFERVIVEGYRKVAPKPRRRGAKKAAE